MSRIRRVFSCTIGFAAVLCASVLVRPASPSEILTTNVRPFFAVGPSIPVDFEDIRRGFGMGFGFEAEQSPRMSVLFRVERYWMRGETPPPNPYYGPSARTLTAIHWSLGARAYLRTDGPVRSYVDGCVGVRLIGDAGAGASPASGVGSSAEPEGLAVTLRFGFSSAGPRRPGFFLDAGLEFLIDNPERYGLVPVRLGAVFP